MQEPGNLIVKSMEEKELKKVLADSSDESAKLSVIEEHNGEYLPNQKQALKNLPVLREAAEKQLTSSDKLSDSEECNANITSFPTQVIDQNQA